MNESSWTGPGMMEPMYPPLPPPEPTERPLPGAAIIERAAAAEHPPQVPEPRGAPAERPPAKPPMPILTRDDILGGDDRPMERVNVPEWGGAVFVRGMTATERDSFEAETLQDRGNGEIQVRYLDMRAKLAVRSIVDSAGNRIFKDEEFGVLSGRAASALDRIFTVAMRLSKISKSDVDKMMGELNAARPSASPSA